MTSTHTTHEKKPAGIGQIIVGTALIGLFAFGILSQQWDYWFGEKQVSNCRNTSKQVQTITKVDGGVDSVVTETVDGCEMPDGTFYPAPLPD